MNVVVSKEALDIVKAALIDLSVNKYSIARMELLADQVESAMEMLKEHVADNNSEIPDVDQSEEVEIDLSNNTGQGRESSLHEAEEDKEHFGLSDETYRSLFFLAFEKLRESKVGNAISHFALPDNINTAGKMIAPELKIDNKTVTEFIEQQKVQRASDQEIVRLVGLAIETLLGSSVKITLKL
jgi:hypothetical protein